MQPVRPSLSAADSPPTSGDTKSPLEPQTLPQPVRVTTAQLRPVGSEVVDSVEPALRRSGELPPDDQMVSEGGNLYNVGKALHENTDSGVLGALLPRVIADTVLGYNFEGMPSEAVPVGALDGVRRVEKHPMKIAMGTSYWIKKDGLAQPCDVLRHVQLEDGSWAYQLRLPEAAAKRLGFSEHAFNGMEGIPPAVRGSWVSPDLHGVRPWVTSKQEFGFLIGVVYRTHVSLNSGKFGSRFRLHPGGDTLVFVANLPHIGGCVVHVPPRTSSLVGTHPAIEHALRTWSVHSQFAAPGETAQWTACLIPSEGDFWNDVGVDLYHESGDAWSDRIAPDWTTSLPKDGKSPAASPLTQTEVDRLWDAWTNGGGKLKDFRGESLVHVRWMEPSDEGEGHSVVLSTPHGERSTGLRLLPGATSEEFFERYSYTVRLPAHEFQLPPQ